MEDVNAFLLQHLAPAFKWAPLRAMLEPKAPEEISQKGWVYILMAIAAAGWWERVMHIPVPPAVLQLEAQAYTWATTLIKRSTVNAQDMVTGDPYAISTADLHAAVSKGQGPNAAVVALAVGTLGLAWNHIGRGQDDACRPVVGPVLLSNSSVRDTEAHSLAAVFAKIPVVLSLPCMVVKATKGKDAKAKINASIHVQGSSRALALGHGSNRPTMCSALLHFAKPDSVLAHWRYAHKIDTFQADWFNDTLQTRPIEDSQVPNVLTQWDNRLVQCWREAGTSSGQPCIEAVVHLLFPENAKWMESQGDTRLATQRCTLGLIGLAFLTANHADFLTDTGPRHLAQSPQDWLHIKMQSSMMMFHASHLPTVWNNTVPPSTTSSTAPKEVVPKVRLLKPNMRMSGTTPVAKPRARRGSISSTPAPSADVGPKVSVQCAALAAEDGWIYLADIALAPTEKDKVKICKGESYTTSVELRKDPYSRARGRELALPRRVMVSCPKKRPEDQEQEEEVVLIMIVCKGRRTALCMRPERAGSWTFVRPFSEMKISSIRAISDQVCVCFLSRRRFFWRLFGPFVAVFVAFFGAGGFSCVAFLGAHALLH